MTRTLSKIIIATFLTTASCAAWAGPNDGPKYPNMTTNKHYTDQRIMDHANRAPRYPVTATGKQYTDKRIMDHNNRAPRYPATASEQTTTGTLRHAYAARRYVPRSSHASAAALAHHG